MSNLEEVVIRALADSSVLAGRVPGQRGVWVDGRRKIASVGIAVEEWVAFHGFALNVNTDLSVFRSFHPCGLPGDVMTSVSRERGRSVSLEELRSPILRAWESVFDVPAAVVGPESLAETPAPALP